MENSANFPNEVIRASAGTGKTFQLSNRYIALANACDRPDEILAATFARKAAGEILDRVVLRLAEAASDPAKFAELAQIIRPQTSDGQFSEADCLGLLAKLIRNLHRLRISTLDSFFIQVAGSFGLELGLPPGWSIVEEVADQRLRSLAIQEVLGEGNVSELMTLLHLLNKGDVTRVVSQQIRQIANGLYPLYRETTPDDPDAAMPPVWQAIARCPQLEEEEWEQALSSLEMLEMPANKNFEKAHQRDYTAACEGDWERLIGGGLVKAIVSGGGLYYRKPLSPETLAVYEPIIRHLKSQFINSIVNQTESTWRMLNHFHQAYQKLKTDQRAYRFQDITQLLADTIQEMDTEQVAFRLDAGAGHLLLDEFQDTSLMQWTVLRPFAESAAKEEGRSFFCVGDVKQAIYGWRGGVADLFGSLETQLENLANRELTRSFRSSQIVIDTVNQVFGSLDSNTVLESLPGVAEVWKARYQTHSTARDFDGYCILQTGWRAEEDEDKQTKTLQFAAAEVARLHRESPGASIGILVRRNQAVARMIYELRHTHHIEASEEGGNPLLDSAAVQLVLSLLAIADHPGDTIARYHVANSPLGPIVGFSDYADADTARRLSLEIRRSLLERGYGASIYQWARELTPFCNPRELTRLMQLVSLAYRYEDHATEQAEDFIETVSATKVEDPSAADVRVMNIHQSKGLQFDIVVLPELDGPIRGNVPRMIVGRPSPTEPVEAVFRYAPEVVLPLLPDRFTHMRDQSHQLRDNESLCLLYVAMTRAVHALHLIIAPSSENERTLPKTHAGVLRSALNEGSLKNPPEEILYQHGNPDWFSKQQPRIQVAPKPDTQEIQIQLPKGELNRKRRLERQAPSDLEGGPSVMLEQCLRENSMLSRTRGLLWHAWLEQVDWLNDDPNKGLPEVETLQTIAGQFLHPRLNLKEEIVQFQKALAQPNIHQALSQQTHVAFINSASTPQLKLYHEYSVAYRENNILTHGIIDRLVLLQDQETVQAAEILDFKTDSFPQEDSKALNKLGQYYQPQLTAYRSAIQKAFSLPPSAITVRLLFLKPGKIWELPSDAAY